MRHRTPFPAILAVISCILFGITTNSTARDRMDHPYDEIAVLAHEDGGLKTCPTQKKTSKAILDEINVTLNEDETSVVWGLIELTVGDKITNATWFLREANKLPGTWYVFIHGRQLFYEDMEDRVVSDKSLRGEGIVTYRPTLAHREPGSSPDALLPVSAFADPEHRDFRFVASGGQYGSSVAMHGARCSDARCALPLFQTAFQMRLNDWREQQKPVINADFKLTTCGEATFTPKAPVTSRK